MTTTEEKCRQLDPIRAQLHHFIEELPEKFGFDLKYGDVLIRFIDQISRISGSSYDWFRPEASEREDGSMGFKEPGEPITYWVYNRTMFLAKAKGLESSLDAECGNSRRSPGQRASLSPTTINVSPTMNQQATATASARAEARTVAKGDLAGLMIAVSGLGLTADGQEQLREAIELDANESGQSTIGTRVRGFMSDLSMEAIGGVGTQILLASPDHLPHVLRAIGQFFGSIT